MGGNFAWEDDSQDVFYKNIDDVMNYKIGDDKFIDICTKFTVIERTFWNINKAISNDEG